jgi:RIO-like serine/threonine protein kinase
MTRRVAERGGKAERRRKRKARALRMKVARRHYVQVARLFYEAEAKYMRSLRDCGRNSPKSKRLAKEMDAIYSNKVRAEVLMDDIRKTGMPHPLGYRP